MTHSIFSFSLMGLVMILGGLLLLAIVVVVIVGLVRSTWAGEGLSERDGDKDSRSDDSPPPAPPVR